MSKLIEMTGKRFGKLFVVGIAVEPKPAKYYQDKCQWWRCACDCGNITELPGKRLRRGEVISCGCARGRIKEIDESAKWACFRNCQRNAERRKIIFMLTLEQFLSITGSPCSYCGIAWSTQFRNYNRQGNDKYHGSYKRNGIDRIDSKIGYVSTNCVPCCKTCNFAKAEMSVEDFKAWLMRVYKHIGLSFA